CTSRKDAFAAFGNGGATRGSKLESCAVSLILHSPVLLRRPVSRQYGSSQRPSAAYAAHLPCASGRSYRTPCIPPLLSSTQPAASPQASRWKHRHSSPQRFRQNRSIVPHIPTEPTA